MFDASTSTRLTALERLSPPDEALAPPTTLIRGLDEPYVVDDALRGRFDRDGHVVLPGFVPPDVLAAFAGPLETIADRVYEPLTARERTLYMGDSLWTRDPLAKQFVTAPRFARAAAELLNVPAVRLWRDVGFFKGPGGDRTPWHQDSFWEPLDGSTMITVWIALEDVSPDMAPLAFVTGSHHRGCVGLVDHNDDAQERHRAMLEQEGHVIADHAPLRAGDATVHFGWTLHAADANRSARRRKAVSILYFPDGARVSVPERPACSAEEEAAWQEVHLHHMQERLTGLAIGDLAASERCPIVFSRGRGS